MQNADYHAEKVLCICYPEGIFVSGLRMHKQLGHTWGHLGGQHLALGGQCSIRKSQTTSWLDFNIIIWLFLVVLVLLHSGKGHGRFSKDK